MIDIIWEETLGKIQTGENEREGTKYDIPFEFEDPNNLTTTTMEISFTPLYLSAFLGYSDELLEVFWHSFKGDHDNVVHHVEQFMTIASKYGIKE